MSSYDQRIRPAMDYMERNLARKVTVADITPAQMHQPPRPEGCSGPAGRGKSSRASTRALSRPSEVVQVSLAIHSTPMNATTTTVTHAAPSLRAISPNVGSFGQVDQMPTDELFGARQDPGYFAA